MLLEYFNWLQLHLELTSFLTVYLYVKVWIGVILLLILLPLIFWIYDKIHQLRQPLSPPSFIPINTSFLFVYRVFLAQSTTPLSVNHHKTLTIPIQSSSNLAFTRHDRLFCLFQVVPDSTCNGGRYPWSFPWWPSSWAPLSWATLTWETCCHIFSSLNRMHPSTPSKN